MPRLRTKQVYTFLTILFVSTILVNVPPMIGLNQPNGNPEVQTTKPFTTSGTRVDKVTHKTIAEMHADQTRRLAAIKVQDDQKDAVIAKLKADLAKVKDDRDDAITKMGRYKAQIGRFKEAAERYARLKNADLDYNDHFVDTSTGLDHDIRLSILGRHNDTITILRSDTMIQYKVWMLGKKKYRPLHNN